jgi:nucleoid-associated protein YgaU
MDVRKPERAAPPGYPSRLQFVRSARRLGLAAFGAGAVGSGLAVERQTPLGGLPPIIVPVAATNGVPPRYPGIPRPMVRLGGEMSVKPLDQTPEKAAAKTCEVKDGDTLSSIARRLLGDANRWPEILTMNPGVKPDALRVGQKLVLPPAQVSEGSRQP